MDFLDLPEESDSLLRLIELPDYIDYLYKINSRTKTILYDDESENA